MWHDKPLTVPRCLLGAECHPCGEPVQPRQADRQAVHLNRTFPEEAKGYGIFPPSGGRPRSVHEGGTLCRGLSWRGQNSIANTNPSPDIPIAKKQRLTCCYCPGNPTCQTSWRTRSGIRLNPFRIPAFAGMRAWRNIAAGVIKDEGESLGNDFDQMQKHSAKRRKKWSENRDGVFSTWFF